MNVYTMPPKEEKPVMGPDETKKCRIVPQKYRFVPDILLNNKRIEEETIMELNKAEIARAMSIAEVYFIAEDGTETLATQENFYVANATSDDTEEGGEVEEPDESGEVTDTPETEPEPVQAKTVADKPSAAIPASVPFVTVDKKSSEEDDEDKDYKY